MRLAVSEGETARLSGQKSRSNSLRGKIGFFKVSDKHETNARPHARCRLLPNRVSSSLIRNVQAFRLVHCAKLSSKFAKRNKPMCCFVPQHKPHTCKTLTQRQSANIRELRIAPKGQWQPVKRNSAAQVMNMVHADIGAEPPQHDRQIIM